MKKGIKFFPIKTEQISSQVNIFLKQMTAFLPLSVKYQKKRAQVLERNGYTCQMCGVAAGDPDPLGGSRTVRLTMGHIKDKSKGGDDTPQNLRAICTNCNEGLQNTALPKPDQIHLLSQTRRATIDDQRILLDWLLKKFNLEAKPKS
ncbi:MAG: HNH endonuclease signature motif containing protein [Sedimentisphaerales bacterium]